MVTQPCYVALFLLAQFFSTIMAQRNITVDDNDPSIVYNAAGWSIPAPSDLDAGGSHHLSEDDNALATFTFTGVSVYFMSPLWPYDVFTQLTLDSQPPVQLNLSDPNLRTPTADGPETVMSAVVWGSGVLPNGTHTLAISKVPQPDRPYAIVDTIIYTVLDTPTPSSSSSLPAGTSSTSSTSSASSSTLISSATNAPSNETSSSSHLPIVLGSVLGAAGVVLLILALWLLCRRRERPKSEVRIAGAGLPPSAPLSPAQPAVQTAYNGRHSFYDANSNPNASWSSPHMSEAGVPLMANVQGNPHTGYNQYTQDFNPWSGFVPVQQQQRQPPLVQQQPDYYHSSLYAPTTLSTITETSTPGTLNSNKIPPDPRMSYPSTDLSFYSPQQGTANGTPLSYATDLPTGAAPALYQHPHPYASASNGQLRSSQPPSIVKNGATSGKLAAEKNPLVAVNRADDEPEDLSPPTYTSH